MNGLDAIISRIKADAQDEARRYEQAAEKEADEIKAKSKADCEMITKAAEEEVAGQVDDLVGRARSMAGLEERKALLAARQDLLGEILDMALQQLAQLPDKEKISFYRNLIRRSGLAKGELILNAADRELGAEILADLDSALQLSEAAGTFTGGLVIRDGLIEENMTLESLLRMNQAELVALAASFLFKGPEGTR